MGLTDFSLIEVNDSALEFLLAVPNDAEIDYVVK